MITITCGAECDHEWVGWSGKMRCRKCGATQQ